MKFQIESTKDAILIGMANRTKEIDGNIDSTIRSIFTDLGKYEDA